MSAVRNGLAQIERDFEYVDARGDSRTMLVNITVQITGGYPETWEEPGYPATAEFVEAEYRNAKGAWIKVQPGEWLDVWVAEVCDRLDECDLLEAVA